MKSIIPKPPKPINPKAVKLVDYLVSEGCSIEEASKKAGYKGNSARVNGYKLLRNPDVQSYLDQQIQASLSTGSAKAVNKLFELSSRAKSEYVQLEASKDILDRAGYKAPEKHQHLVAGDFKINIDLS